MLLFLPPDRFFNEMLKSFFYIMGLNILNMVSEVPYCFFLKEPHHYLNKFASQFCSLCTYTDSLGYKG